MRVRMRVCVCVCVCVCVSLSLLPSVCLSLSPLPRTPCSHPHSISSSVSLSVSVCLSLSLSLSLLLPSTSCNHIPPILQLVFFAVVFDPASFYGHAEFDLSMAYVFGGFPPEFFRSYFSVIPKEQGFDRRLDLYKVFHYLNHWLAVRLYARVIFRV